MRTFVFFKWSTQVNCSSYGTKGEEHSNLQSPSFSDNLRSSLTSSSWTCFLIITCKSKWEEWILHARSASKCTVVSHLETRNGRPIGQMKSEWGTDTAKHWRCCILTTNYLISQTWGRFISILWVWWTSDSFMALRIEMNLYSKW